MPTLGGVVDPKRTIFDAVSVLDQVVVNGAGRGKGRGEHKNDLVLPQHVGGAVL